MLCPPSTQQAAAMDTSDWLKAIVQENEATPMMMDSSSPSPSPDFLRQRPPPPPPPPSMLERRLRPPHDQPLKCPRCDSAHTKFCYYNNYSLSQPRYFCKTCRRYWTKGGSLRNVPVGGGCRKNKRSGGAKKAAGTAASVDHHPLPFGQFPPPGAYIDMGGGSTELHLSTFQGLLPAPPPLSHFNPRGLSGFMECKYAPAAFDAAEAKFGGILADPRGQFLLGLDGGDHGAMSGFGEMPHGYGMLSPAAAATTFGGMASALGFSMDMGSHGSASMMENCQRLALPWTGNDDDAISAVESKPDPKLLSLEWQEQCGEVAREPFAYSATGGGGAMWSGVVSSHHVGTSTATNPLV